MGIGTFNYLWHNRENLKINDPVVLYWMNNQAVYKKFELSNYSTTINLSDEYAFKKGIRLDQKFNYVIILLPQVLSGNEKILPDEQKERMYIMMYKD